MKNGFKVLDSDLHTMEPDGLCTAVVGKDLQRRAFARHPHYEVAHARGYDAESHVQAMDIEGIDVAVHLRDAYPHSDGLFPTAIEEFTRLEGVSDKSKTKILWDNCAHLYNLGERP